MKYDLPPGKVMNFTSPNGQSTEITLSLHDGTIIKTVLPSRCVFSVTAGTAFKGADFQAVILKSRPIGLAD